MLPRHLFPSVVAAAGAGAVDVEEHPNVKWNAVKFKMTRVDVEMMLKLMTKDVKLQKKLILKSFQIMTVFRTCGSVARHLKDFCSIFERYKSFQITKSFL